MELANQTFSKSAEVIDGNQYTDCRFENCQMIYRGGEIPRINKCHFETCTWQFEDAAERTLLFMKFLYHGMGDGGKDLIESTINAIRQPFQPGG